VTGVLVAPGRRGRRRLLYRVFGGKGRWPTPRSGTGGTYGDGIPAQMGRPGLGNRYGMPHAIAPWAAIGPRLTSVESGWRSQSGCGSADGAVPTHSGGRAQAHVDPAWQAGVPDQEPGGAGRQAGDHCATQHTAENPPRAVRRETSIRRVTPVRG